MIFYIRDKQTDRNLFEVEIYGKKNDNSEYIYDIYPDCYTSNILEVIDQYNKYTLIKVIKEFEFIRGNLFEIQPNVKELVKDKGKLIKFTKEYLENYVLDILNKVKDMVYMVTD